MDIHLIDGTYELFRYFYAVPSSKDDFGQEIGAVRGVLGSILTMIEGGATHVGVATDHVIESFRNDLYPGYKTGGGQPPRPFCCPEVSSRYSRGRSPSSGAIPPRSQSRLRVEPSQHLHHP